MYNWYKNGYNKNERMMKDMDLIPRGYFSDIFDNFSLLKENSMKCDIYEKEGNYHIEMDIPGFNKEDIKIGAKNDYLTITAEKANENNDDDNARNYVHRERTYGKYQRSFYLNGLDSENIDAEFTGGVLKIMVPKKENTDDRKYIEIK